MIVINPIVETGLVRFSVPSDVRSLLFGSKIASLYVQPHIGGDLALLTGVAKRIVEMNAHDEAFLNNHCQGWPELQVAARTTCRGTRSSPRAASRATRSTRSPRATPPRRTSSSVGRWASRTTPTACKTCRRSPTWPCCAAWSAGPAAACCPSAATRTCRASARSASRRSSKTPSSTGCRTHFGVKLPTTPGRDTMACIDGAAAGELKVGFCLGGNLYGSNPDATFAAKSLGKLDLLVYLSTTLNTGHAHGLARETIILPVLARDEEPQPTTQESMFNYIRLSDGGPRRHDGPRSRSRRDRVDCARGSRSKSNRSPHRLGIDDAQHRRKSARPSPTSSPASKSWPTSTARRRNSTSPAARSTSRASPRPTARPACTCTSCPTLHGTGAGELRLMTIRSEGQFNTVVYEDEDIYRDIDRRDVILLHPDDLARFGLNDGDRVTVHGPAGAMHGIRATEFPTSNPATPRCTTPRPTSSSAARSTRRARRRRSSAWWCGWSESSNSSCDSASDDERSVSI